MRDDFDDIRAEREMPLRTANPPAQHAGLWKQIAIGIVVGHLSLGLIGSVGWVIAMQLSGGAVGFVAPWAS